MTPARDSPEVLGLNPKVGNGVAFVPPARPAMRPVWRVRGASMAARAPASPSAPREVRGRRRRSSIEMDGTLGTPTASARPRRRRATPARARGLDTAEFGRPSLPEKPSFPSALPRRCPRSTSRRNTASSSAHARGEIDADADADAFGQNTPRVTRRGRGGRPRRRGRASPGLNAKMRRPIHEIGDCWHNPYRGD